jgi:hypothetical protein
MAVVAAYHANQDGYPADHIYVVTLNRPGDHSFCLVSDRPIPVESREWGSLHWFLRQRTQHLLIDPWLKTACLSRNYQRNVAAKLSDWAEGGKRIAWDGADGTQPGWYPPNGAYQRAMERAPVSLRPYTRG